MISKELAEKYHLPPIKEYPFSERDWYHTFLIQSDYVALKIAEAAFTGESVDDYTEVLQARAYARQKINEIEDGT